MAAFTVRVELHGNPTWDDYETLHTAMEAESFRRTITDSEGVEYHLPMAEYNFYGDLDRSQVLERAKIAASETGKKYSAFVTESNGRTWVGLKALKNA